MQTKKTCDKNRMHPKRNETQRREKIGNRQKFAKVSTNLLIFQFPFDRSPRVSRRCCRRPSFSIDRATSRIGHTMMVVTWTHALRFDLLLFIQKKCHTRTIGLCLTYLALCLNEIVATMFLAFVRFPSCIHTHVTYNAGSNQ